MANRTIKLSDGTIVRMVPNKVEPPKEAVQDKDVLVVTCVERTRDNSGKIISYLLQDSTGNQRRFSPNILKQQIFNGIIRVNNLTLTSDGRLLEKTPEQNDTNKTVGVSNEILANKFMDLLSRLFDHFEHTKEWSDELGSYIIRFKLINDSGSTICKYKGTEHALLKANNKILEGCSELILGCKANLIRPSKDVKDLLVDFNLNVFTVENNQITKSIRAELTEIMLNYLLDTMELLTYVSALKKLRSKADINIEEQVHNMNMKNQFDDNIMEYVAVASVALARCLGLMNEHVITVLASGNDKISDGARNKINANAINFAKKSLASALRGNVIPNIVGKEMYESNEAIFEDYNNRFEMAVTRMAELVNIIYPDGSGNNLEIGVNVDKLANTRPLYLDKEQKSKFKNSSTDNKQSIFNMFKR